jgi:hypothetical protein
VRGLYIAVIGLFPQVATADCLRMTDMGYALLADPEVQMTVGPGFVTLEFAPDGRSSKTLSLVAVEADAFLGATAGESRTLTNGIVVNYDTQISEAEGSGGAEAILWGWLETNPPVQVSCHMQAEQPDARWCVAVLEELRPLAEGCPGKGG